MIEEVKKLYRRARVTFVLLTIILAYFIVLILNGGSTNTETLIRFGALFPPYIYEYHQYYRFVTAIFIHIGPAHILFNSYALYIFGPIIERLMGEKKYLAFFLLTGIGGNIITFIFNFFSLSAGASGSLFGLFGAFLYLIHRHREMVTEQGRKDIMYMLTINLVLTFISPSISTTAHLGGLIIGYLLSYIFIR